MYYVEQKDRGKTRGTPPEGGNGENVEKRARFLAVISVRKELTSCFVFSNPGRTFEIDNTTIIYVVQYYHLSFFAYPIYSPTPLSNCPILYFVKDSGPVSWSVGNGTGAGPTVRMGGHAIEFG